MDLRELLSLEGKEEDFMEVDAEKYYKVFDAITGLFGIGWTMRYQYDCIQYCYDILSNLTYTTYLDSYNLIIGVIKYEGIPSIVYKCAEEDYKFYIIDEEFNSIINMLKDGYYYACSKVAEEDKSIKWLK